MLRISDFLSLDSVEEIEKEPSRARQLISHVFNPKHNRLHRTVRCQLRFFCESKLIVFKVHKLYHQKTDDSTTLAYQILEKISYIIRYSEMEHSQDGHVAWSQWLMRYSSPNNDFGLRRKIECNSQ